MSQEHENSKDDILVLCGALKGFFFGKGYNKTQNYVDLCHTINNIFGHFYVKRIKVKRWAKYSRFFIKMLLLIVIIK